MAKNERIAHNHIFDYLGAKYNSVNQAYKSPSIYKRDAEKNILEEMNKNNGVNYRVISFNSQQFSCGYTYVNSEGKSRFVYHTANHRRECDF